MRRPLLLIDIDGVISLFGFDPASPPDGKYLLVDGIPHFLSLTAAAALETVKNEFELVWCSGWEERADDYLPHALGLPAGLRHLTFDDAMPAGAAPGTAPRRHWKLAAIDRYAGPHRPLAWIDDAFDDTCHAWARARPGPTELISTDAATGMTADHATHLRRWARSLRPGGASTAPPRSDSTP